jgi:hypothetical protein
LPSLSLSICPLNTTNKLKAMPWEIIHDNSFCMFKIILDSVGSTGKIK